MTATPTATATPTPTSTATVTTTATSAADTDGDGIPDAVEGSGDRDHDGLPDNLDYDPTGYLYDEATGRILAGGHVVVTGPGPVTLVHDGASGFYQFTISTPGVYTILVVPPPYTQPSTTCLRQDPPAFDPTGGPDPYVLGNGENGNSGALTSNACTPFYLTMDLDPADPVVIDNNIPFRVLGTPVPVTSRAGVAALIGLLGSTGLWWLGRAARARR